MSGAISPGNHVEVKGLQNPGLQEVETPTRGQEETAVTFMEKDAIARKKKQKNCLS